MSERRSLSLHDVGLVVRIFVYVGFSDEQMLR